MARKAGRINKELADLNRTPIAGVEVAPTENDVMIWNIHIDGPEGTPFIGGRFTVNLDFTDNYPFKPPKIKFITKIYHPGVKTDTGEICTQAIEQNWVPTLNAKFVIEAILTVLKTPNAENAQEMSIASQWQSNRQAWEATAAEWVQQYAQPQ